MLNSNPSPAPKCKTKAEPESYPIAQTSF